MNKHRSWFEHIYLSMELQKKTRRKPLKEASLGNYIPLAIYNEAKKSMTWDNINSYQKGIEEYFEERVIFLILHDNHAVCSTSRGKPV